MEQNKATIGKVKEYDNQKGVGKIVSMYNSYMFLCDDLCDNDINKGDLVKFRAENINGQNKAFFIKKYNLQDDMNGKTAKSKIYRSNN